MLDYLSDFASALARERSEAYVWSGKASHIGRRFSALHFYKVCIAFAKTRNQTNSGPRGHHGVAASAIRSANLMPAMPVPASGSGTMGGVASWDGGRSSVLVFCSFRHLRLHYRYSSHMVSPFKKYVALNKGERHSRNPSPQPEWRKTRNSLRGTASASFASHLSFIFGVRPKYE